MTLLILFGFFCAFMLGMLTGWALAMLERREQ